jgi:hypothetical protein
MQGRSPYTMPYSRPQLPNEATIGSPVPNVNAQPTQQAAMGPPPGSAFVKDADGLYNNGTVTNKQGEQGTRSTTPGVQFSGTYDPAVEAAGGYMVSGPQQSAQYNAAKQNYLNNQQTQPTISSVPAGDPSVSSGPGGPSAPGGGGNGGGPQSFDQYRDSLGGAVDAYGRQVGRQFHQNVGKMLGDLNSIGGLRSGGVQTGMRDLSDAYGQQIGDYAAQTAGHALDAWQSGDQFTRGQAQQESQFGRTFGEGQRQFDADLGFRNAELGENSRQFNTNFGQREKEFNSDFGLRRDQFGVDRDFRAADLGLRQNQQNDERSQYKQEYDFRNQQYKDAKNASKKRGIGKLIGGAVGGIGGFMAGGPAGAMAGYSLGSSVGGSF